MDYSVGDNIPLINQAPEIVSCDNCDHKMVNVDKDQLRQGDLATLKREGIRVSNPDTEENICANCELEDSDHPFHSWWDDKDDEDDSSYFTAPTIASTYDNDSGGSSGGFGGFGGFGGGSFSGGGASGGF